jgi:nucleoside-diphosphate-sugar epimerase
MNDNNQALHVIFGTGALGQAVMRKLLAQNQRVRMISRSGKAIVPTTVEVMQGDATDPASTRTVCQGGTIVYNCAAPAYTDWATSYPAMQAGIIEGAAAAEAILVSAENLYIYGLVTQPMTEDLPFRPNSRKGEIRAQMSIDLMAAHKAGKVRATIGRAPDFYGPVAALTTVYGERVFNPALIGKTVSVLGKLDMPHTFIYVDDFAQGLVTLGAHESALGESWHLPSAPTLTQRELLTLIFAAAGHSPKLAETPSWVIKGLGLVSPLMREFVEMLYEFEQPFVVSHAKYDRVFGSQVTTHNEAIQQTLAWFRQNSTK